MNPITYIQNKLCKYITGLEKHELEEFKEKFEKFQWDNDYISRSDFDPDDYNLDALNDYDFNEFVTEGNFTDLLVDNEYVSQSDLDTAVEDAISDYLSKEEFSEELNKLNERLEKLEPKKKINLKKKKPEDKTDEQK